MPIGTQIDITLGVLAFLAAQALIGAGFVLFRWLRDPSGLGHVAETDEGPRGAVQRNV